MYSSIISNAVQKSAFERVTKTANMSMMSAGHVGRRSGTTGSTAAFDGKVNVGLSTSSSIRSNGAGEMPHLVPQKTNVLTGATTKYFSNQASLWKAEYSDLVTFQKLRQKHEQDSIAQRQSMPEHSGRARNHLTGIRTGKSQGPTTKITMPLRGKGVKITD